MTEHVDHDSHWAVGRVKELITTSVPAEAIAHIDFLAAQHGHTRAGVLRAMVRASLDDPDSFAEAWLHSGPTKSPLDPPGWKPRS